MTSHNLHKKNINDTTKIYLKGINIDNIFQDKIKKIKAKNSYKTIYKKLILTNKGIFECINDTIFVIVNNETIHENKDFFLVHKNIKKHKCYQIPYNYKALLIKQEIIKINNFKIIFEYLEDKLHDFYLLDHGVKNIDDFILNSEISLVREMLI